MARLSIEEHGRPVEILETRGCSFKISKKGHKTWPDCLSKNTPELLKCWKPVVAVSKFPKKAITPEKLNIFYKIFHRKLACHPLLADQVTSYNIFIEISHLQNCNVQIFKRQSHITHLHIQKSAAICLKRLSLQL